MEIGQRLLPINTDCNVTNPTVLRKNRLRSFFGLPKLIDGEQVDNKNSTWSLNTLLCATIFLEDAVNYRSIGHQVSNSYLYIYRWFSSPFVRKLHRIVLLINLCLAFFEKPSSFSRTSDTRDKPNRIVFPFMLLITLEGLTLIWFLIYICAKIACIGLRNARKHFWCLAFLLVIVYSLFEWFPWTSLVSKAYHGIRYRRIFRPLFLIESSQLMKKALKAVKKDLLTIIACISMAFTHIFFFAVVAMFLFPKSKTREDSQGSQYFPDLHDSFFNLLVLHSTANNPDIMMPAYSDFRLNVLFFLIFVIIGIYCIQNLVTAVVYRAFRGYFLTSIINLQLRRRVAIRASFEVLRKRTSNGGSIEIQDTIPISIVETVVHSTLMSKWHSDRIFQRLLELKSEVDTIDLDQYSKTMEILDLNPNLISEVELPTLGESVIDWFKTIGRSRIFDQFGTLLALLSVILTTVEVSHRHSHTNYKALVSQSLPLAIINFTLMIFFVFEIIFKSFSFGLKNFFRLSSSHILEAIVAFSCLIMQIIHMGIYGTPALSEHDFNLTGVQIPFLSLWEAIKACNMLFIYRLVRFLPASRNIQIIVGTVIDEIRNGGAFFGVLFSFYYAYAILGMELFQGVVENLYIKQNQTNITYCGTYEQLGYWPNNFDDFFASIVTLYNIMIVNQWFIFVDAVRDATNTRWSEIYFIFWYLFVTTLGLNICLALGGDIYDVKKQRADEHGEILVSNMYDIFRSQLDEPSPDLIIAQLNAHPYINFRHEISSATAIA